MNTKEEGYERLALEISATTEAYKRARLLAARFDCLALRIDSGQQAEARAVDLLEWMASVEEVLTTLDPK